MNHSQIRMTICSFQVIAQHFQSRYIKITKWTLQFKDPYFLSSLIFSFPFPGFFAMTTFDQSLFFLVSLLSLASSPLSSPWALLKSFASSPLSSSNYGRYAVIISRRRSQPPLACSSNGFPDTISYLRFFNFIIFSRKFLEKSEESANLN